MPGVDDARGHDDSAASWAAGHQGLTTASTVYFSATASNRALTAPVSSRSSRWLPRMR